MATARGISVVPNANELQVDANDGKTYRYKVKHDKLITPPATIHVQARRSGLVPLMGSNGKTLLRQDGDGLPSPIYVQVADPGVFGFTAGGGWYECELVP
jgi:hypothetical protein